MRLGESKLAYSRKERYPDFRANVFMLEFMLELKLFEEQKNEEDADERSR